MSSRSGSPAGPSASDDAITAIAEADIIVLGPGSLYTSVLPRPRAGIGRVPKSPAA